MPKRSGDKLQKVLDFIITFSDENGYPPTVREICQEINVSSSATAQYYLNKLEEKGFIKRKGSKNRAIEIVGVTRSSIIGAKNNAPAQTINLDNIVEVPVVGKVAAGVPILATENVEESICLPRNYFSNDDLFILKVAGDSMINSGILDGDKIIVKKQNTAQNGEIVVAMTMDNEATLKRFYKEKDHIRLQPENDTMSPIILPNCTILGKAIGLYRKF